MLFSDNKAYYKNVLSNELTIHESSFRGSATLVLSHGKKSKWPVKMYSPPLLLSPLSYCEVDDQLKSFNTMICEGDAGLHFKGVPGATTRDNARHRFTVKVGGTGHDGAYTEADLQAVPNLEEMQQEFNGFMYDACVQYARKAFDANVALWKVAIEAARTSAYNNKIDALRDQDAENAKVPGYVKKDIATIDQLFEYLKTRPEVAKTIDDRAFATFLETFKIKFASPKEAEEQPMWFLTRKFRFRQKSTISEKAPKLVKSYSYDTIKEQWADLLEEYGNMYEWRPFTYIGPDNVEISHSPMQLSRPIKRPDGSLIEYVKDPTFCPLVGKANLCSFEFTLTAYRTAAYYGIKINPTGTIVIARQAPLPERGSGLQFGITAVASADTSPVEATVPAPVEATGSAEEPVTEVTRDEDPSKETDGANAYPSEYSDPESNMSAGDKHQRDSAPTSPAKKVKYESVQEA